MDNFLRILTMPDNLPIAGMAVALVYLLIVWWRQAVRNDRLVREGRERDIAEDMRR